MILNILKASNLEESKILKAPSVDVVDFTQEIHDLAMNMIETMYASNGAGLAAPQVGRNINLFVMRTEHGLDTNIREHIVVVNPFTAFEGGDPIIDKEGCLSIPGIWGDVLRFKEVGTVYQDTTGKRTGGVFTGFQARVYQHEYDHLVGTLFVERASKFYRQKAV
jgi:peptide deformylase